jgi:hypothetical protein
MLDHPLIESNSKINVSKNLSEDKNLDDQFEVKEFEG